MENEVDHRSYTGRIASFQRLRQPPFNLDPGGKVIVNMQESTAFEFAVLSLETRTDAVQVIMVPHSLIIMDKTKKGFLIKQLNGKA